MVVVAKVCELTDVFLWFACGLYVGILTSPLMNYLCGIRDLILGDYALLYITYVMLI